MTRAPVRVSVLHPGWCPACDDRIHRGDDITASPDGWQHRDCGAPDTPTNPCPTCWLVGPCDCEDAL